MPDALREGGYSLRSGDPRELAQALVDHLAASAAELAGPPVEDAV